MIARLRGVPVSRDGDRVVLDVHGVGYAVHGPARCLDQWAVAEDDVIIHVSTDVREDAITLYGFTDDVDRVAFERLRQVNGVGPKVALATLDTLGLDGLAKAVAADDTVSLARVSGVGKKLAQRLALELKGKLPAGFSPETAAAGATAVPDRRKEDQLDLALARLGYSRSEIVRAHRGLEGEGIAPDVAVADRLKAALRLLSGS